MRSMEEILKSSGLNTATTRASGGSEQVRIAEPPADEDKDVCARCGGAGFVRKAVRLGHPDFGKAFPCECTQDESEDARLARLQRYSNLGPLARLTFDNLSPLGRSPNPAHQKQFSGAVEAAKRFASQPEGWIVFSGPSGCGKTHLAAAIAGSCIAGGQAAIFMVTPDLLDHLRSAYQPGSDVGYDDLFELVRNAPVLILDDLGVQSSTPWAEEKLFQLINHRYNGQLPTVFTTNLNPEEFEPRIQSRLSDGTLSQIYYLESGPHSGIQILDSLDLPLLRGMTFKTFDTRRANNPTEANQVAIVYRHALDFARQPQRWFTIAGDSGRGKTHLAAAIGNYCRDSGMQVMFVTVPDLLDWLRSAYNPQNPLAFDSMFAQVRGVPLLVLDDLGSQSGTAWADEKLFQLLNHRYNASLPTVMTTSAAAAELEGRIRTRITDLEVNTFLLMGEFDFWGHGSATGRPSTRPRGRPPRRS